MTRFRPTVKKRSTKFIYAGISAWIGLIIPTLFTRWVLEIRAVDQNALTLLLRLIFGIILAITFGVLMYIYVKHTPPE